MSQPFNPTVFCDSRGKYGGLCVVVMMVLLLLVVVVSLYLSFSLGFGTSLVVSSLSLIVRTSLCDV